MTVSPKWDHKIMLWKNPKSLIGLHSGFLYGGSDTAELVPGDALLLGMTSTSANSSFLTHKILFPVKLLIFPDVIWKPDLRTEGIQRTEPGFQGGLPSQDAEPEEIFQRHEVNPGGAVRNHPLACAEDAWFFILERSFSLCRHFSLVPLSDSGRVVLKPCEYRKSGKNDTSV